MPAEPRPHEIIAEARTWLGTPFRHQGRRKGAGVDCAGVLVASLQALGVAVVDDLTYAHRPDPKALRAYLDTQLRRVRRCEIEYGDVLLMTFTAAPHEATHLALRTDIGLLHAYAPARQVIETVLDPVLARGIVQVYRWPWLP